MKRTLETKECDLIGTCHLDLIDKEFCEGKKGDYTECPAYSIYKKESNEKFRTIYNFE